MATNYPTSLDTFTNPSAGSALNSPSHAGQHADINDAMEAVQAKLGVGAGTIGTWTAYTPTLTNFTASAITAEYATINEFVALRAEITIASVSALPQMSVPITAVPDSLGAGTCGFLVGPQWYLAWLDLNASLINFWTINVAGTYPVLAVTGSSVPATWTSGSKIYAHTFYKAA